MSTTTIDVFADVMCPFTHVGLLRFVERRQGSGRPDLRLHVHAWPLEVINGKPLDPGHVADEVDLLRGDAAPDLFAGFDRAAFPTTSLPAFALAAVAYERDVATGEQVSLDLRDALFERGLDIGRTDVIESVAERHGLTVDVGAGAEVASASLEEGRARGVVGSPHFFTGHGAFFCPSLDVHRDEGGHLVVHRDPEGFERFLEACFG